MQQPLKHWLLTTLFGLLLCMLISGCKKQDPNLLNRAAIVLTFDDKFIDNWHSYMTFFQENDVRATFYISAYHRFTEEEKTKLLEMQNLYGCEVGHHSKNHLRLFDFLKENTPQDYIENEVLPTLKTMRKDGFDVQNFAYPFGEASDEVEFGLWKHFKSVRHLAWTNAERPLIKQDLAFYDLNKIHERQGRLHAAAIDSGYAISTAQILEAIDRCAENKEALMLYAHSIGQVGDYSLPEKRLKKLVAHAQKRGVVFITVKEMLSAQRKK